MVLILYMSVRENVYKNFSSTPSPAQIVDHGRSTAFYKIPIQRF